MALFKISISYESDCPLRVISNRFVEEELCLRLMSELMLDCRLENIKVEVTNTKSGISSSKRLRTPKE